jgi:hypothetical protein
MLQLTPRFTRLLDGEAGRRLSDTYETTDEHIGELHGPIKGIRVGREMIAPRDQVHPDGELESTEGPPRYRAEIS